MRKKVNILLIITCVLISVMGCAAFEIESSPPPYEINYFGLLDDMQNWLQELDVNQTKDKSFRERYGDITCVVEECKNNGIPIPIIDGQPCDFEKGSNFLIYYNGYTNIGSGIGIPVFYVDNMRISMTISIIPNDLRELAQKGIVDYWTDNTLIPMNYYDNKETICSRRGCLSYVRYTVQDTVRNVKINNYETELLTRKFNYFSEATSSEFSVFIYDNLLIRIDNLFPESLLLRLSFKREQE